MFDEVDIFSRLESSLLGSMIHAVSVSALAVNADASAIRLFDGPGGTTPSYVNATALTANGVTTTALQNWPTSEDSVFEIVRARGQTDDAFRPCQLPNDPAGDCHRLFQPFAAVGSVTDAFCLTYPLFPPAWCMIVYLRCNPSPVFEDEQIQTLQRLKPALARVTKTGYQREIHGHTAVTYGRDVASTPTDEKTARLLDKLSRTERLVLSFLRSETTERQIAQTIHRSPHTIHVHVKNIYRKLGVNSRRTLTALFDRDRS